MATLVCNTEPGCRLLECFEDGLTGYPGADIRFTQAEVPDVHAEMVAAAGDRDVWIVGGGDLAGQFADRGLLDEVVVSIAPVTLGSGAPLLPRRRVIATGR